MTGRLPPEALERAAALLRAGDLVAFPTETVYGLGADARNGRAVAGIFAAKGRPRFNPLICHFPDAEAAFAEVVADERARSLAERFWPGPLTLVLPRRRGSKVDLLTTAGTETMAVRVPAIPWRGSCCGGPARRSRRPRPIPPAAFRRPRRSMSCKGSAGASRRCWMADPAPSGWKARC